MKSFFKYFDMVAGQNGSGENDDMLTREEAIAGTLELAEKMHYFEAEYNYYM